MSLKPNESLLSEAIKNMLNDAALGDETHKDRYKSERAHTFTFLHEEIEQTFRLQAIDLIHQDGVCSAFSKIHSIRYLDDPKFTLSFQKEMSGRAIPEDEQNKGMKILESVRKKFLKDSDEKDAGWQPDMADIKNESQPSQIKESKNTADPERKFFSNPRARAWISNQDTFWESINTRITPHIKEMGYECDTPKQFWEAYDRDEVNMVISDWMHELFEQLKAEYRTISDGK